jgi:riboflavin synthase
MFTGLVESVGTLQALERHDGGARLTVSAPAWQTPLELGESIAVQGACLTVAGFDSQSFHADVLDETLRRTNLMEKHSGQLLNLERALRFGDRLGGHLVSGHVDAVSRLLSIRMEGRDRVLRLSCDERIAVEVVEKGSIALDGISLTVSSVATDYMEVCVIPWTWGHTSLQERKEGDTINVETDMIGKYIQRHLTMRESGKGGVNQDMLAAAGFMG